MSGIFAAGFALSFTLILAIGSQNAFVLRQGIMRQNVLPIVLFCGFSDALFILLGVFGVGALVVQFPIIKPVMIVLGAIFLIGYGLLRLRTAARPRPVDLNGETTQSIAKALLIAAGFTYLNPHVYLDTIVLIGGFSSQYAINEKAVFAAGATSASVSFFFLLGYGARFLTPYFQNPRAWQYLDAAIGVLMLVLAWLLITEL